LSLLPGASNTIACIVVDIAQCCASWRIGQVATDDVPSPSPQGAEEEAKPKVLSG